MAYDPGAENARLLLRAIRGGLDFAGRSRRTEWLYYVIACALLQTVVNFTAGFVLPTAAAALLSTALWIVLSLPMPALFVRRLHDQNRSGWWAMLLILQIGPALYFEWLRTHDMTAYLDAVRGFGPIRLAQVTTSLAILVIVFWRGTVGSNAYGGDPRLSE